MHLAERKFFYIEEYKTPMCLDASAH